MSDQEQWTPGTTSSDAKLGTDDPAEEARNVESQVGERADAAAAVDDGDGQGGTSDDDGQPEDTGATGTLGEAGLA